MAHNRVDGFASSRFFLTESIVLTIKSNVAQIELIFITIESILSTIESVSSIESVYHDRVDSCRNRVDSEHNRVDSGAAHNTIFGSTILKQTACHKAQACFFIWNDKLEAWKACEQD